MSEPPLFFAASAGHVEQVAALIKAGADVNLRDAKGSTALLAALWNKQYEVAQLLLKAGANVDLKSKGGYFAVEIVAGQLHLQMLQNLIAAYPRPTKTMKKALGLALCKAAFAPNHDEKATENIILPIVDLVLKHEPDLDVHFINGKTPLMCATFTGLDNVATRLLDAGADVNARGEDGSTALHVAGLRGRLEIAKELLERGAELNPTNDAGQSPLAMAQKAHKDFKGSPLGKAAKAIAELLVQRGGAVETAEKIEIERAKADLEARRWGPETPRPVFDAAGEAQQYKDALTELSARCGVTAQPENQLPGLFMVQAAGEGEIDAIQAGFLPKGCFVFHPQITNKRTMAVLPTTDKYEVIAAMQTNGANYGIGPGGIIQWLKELEQEQPFVLTGIGSDFLDGRFLGPVKNPAKLAKKMYEFCPDIIDQGCGDVQALAAELKKSGRLYFWWD